MCYLNFLKAIPDTVRHNVKNVTGFRGGAERGFLATYPDCIHTLLEHTHPDLKTWNTQVSAITIKNILIRVNPEMSNMFPRWFSLQVLTYNLSSDVVGPRFGMLVPITYYHLGSNRDDMTLAQVYMKINPSVLLLPSAYSFIWEKAKLYFFRSDNSLVFHCISKKFIECFLLSPDKINTAWNNWRKL